MTDTDDAQPLGKDMPKFLAGLAARTGTETDADRARRAEEDEAEQIEWMRESWQRRLDALIPPRYRNAVADHHQVITWAASVARDPLAASSLLLLGPTGTGKTHQAYGALAVIATTCINMRRRPPYMDAIASADLYARLRPRPGRDHDPEDELRKLCEAELLMVDDLAAAKASEWTEEITYRLINHRYERCLPSIFTTNLPLADLKDALGDRIASRLAETTTRVVLDGADRRRNRGAA